MSPDTSVPARDILSEPRPHVPAQPQEVTAWPKDPRTGRRLMTPKVVDYDLAGAPPVIRLLADGVRAMADEDVKAEAINQWPREFPVVTPAGFATPEVHRNEDGSIRTGFWFPEDIKRARNKLCGYAVGIALGVTKVEAEPITDPVKAAANLDLDIMRRQEAEREAKRKAKALKAQRVEGNRAKAKAARKSRKGNR